MFGNRLANTNAGGGGCTNTVDNYNPFPDGGGVALYQLNGDATDVSGNYDGTASNVTYGTGQFGQAAQFNGSNSYVLIADSPALRLTGDYAISFWFKTNSIGAIQRLVNKDNANDFSGGWALVLEPDSSITWVHNNGSTNQNWNTGVSITANTWYYVTAVYSDSNNLRSFYLNGSLQNTITTNTNVASETDVLLFGAYGQSSPLGQYFNGSLDQVRIFNRALRPYEVEALYTEEYCTPTIVPSEHFNTVTWTGDSSSNRNITGVGFQPDLIWEKGRTQNANHRLVDSVRGVGNVLSSSLTDAEFTETGDIESINSDGFVLGSNADYNLSGQDYVSWNFKAGGDAVSNPEGNTTSQISANPDAGFSIVTHTSSMLSSQTFGHGLNSTPKIVISKVRNIADSWWVFMPDVIGSTNVLELNATAAARSVGLTFNANDTTFNIQWTSSSYDFLHYCFAEVAGFSKFGSYTGTGTSLNQINVGFAPRFVMIKRTDSTGGWRMYDNVRGLDKSIQAQSSDAEYDDTTNYLDFYSNGFEFNNGVSYQSNPDINASGGTFIYMAFANQF